MLMMFKLLNVLYMIYMFNIIVWEISPLLLENVALRMGNLQVIKTRSVREWTPHLCLGALIRNGMGLTFISIPYVSFMNFLWISIEPNYEIFW
jgi:hypothetical protein